VNTTNNYYGGKNKMKKLLFSGVLLAVLASGVRAAENPDAWFNEHNLPLHFSGMQNGKPAFDVTFNDTTSADSVAVGRIAPVLKKPEDVLELDFNGLQFTRATADAKGNVNTHAKRRLLNADDEDNPLSRLSTNIDTLRIEGVKADGRVGNVLLTGLRRRNNLGRRWGILDVADYAAEQAGIIGDLKLYSIENGSSISLASLMPWLGNQVMYGMKHRESGEFVPVVTYEVKPLISARGVRPLMPVVKDSPLDIMADKFGNIYFTGANGTRFSVDINKLNPELMGLIREEQARDARRVLRSVQANAGYGRVNGKNTYDISARLAIRGLQIGAGMYQSVNDGTTTESSLRALSGFTENETIARRSTVNGQYATLGRIFGDRFTLTPSLMLTRESLSNRVNVSQEVSGSKGVISRKAYADDRKETSYNIGGRLELGIPVIGQLGIIGWVGVRDVTNINDVAYGAGVNFKLGGRQ